MDSNRFFQELLDYNYYCNQRLLDLLVENRTSIPDETIKLASHISNAHNVWNSRLDNKTATVEVWATHSIGSLKEKDQQNYQESSRLLKNAALQDILTYSNTVGKSFSNSVRDILFQIINHSTHHRAQISHLLRTAGIEPLASDYIFYKR